MTVTATFEVAGKSAGDDIAAADTGALTAWDAVGAATRQRYAGSPAHGSLCGEFNSAWGTGYVLWVVSNTLTHHFGRIYVKPLAGFDNNIAVRMEFQKATTDRCACIAIDASYHVRILDAGASTVGTSTTTLPTNAWSRLEWDFTHHASAGAGAVRIYTSMDSTSIDETLSVSGQNFDGAALARIQLGILSGATADFYVDDIVGDTGSFPGPVIPPPTGVQNVVVPHRSVSDVRLRR